MDPITISIVINAALSIAGAFGWIKKNKEVKQMADVMERCPTKNQDLKEIAVLAGLDVAAKTLKKLLK